MAAYSDLEVRVKKWISDLELYNEGPFWRNHGENEWSIGQMYYFLTEFGSHETVGAIAKCLSHPEEKSKKTLKGKMTFLMGTPKGLKQLALKPTLNKPSIFEIKDKLIKLLKDFSEFEYPLKAKGAVEYSVYGTLSAKEWFDLLLIYFDYFEKKKQEVNKHFV